jgi:hypothetical protein
LAKLIEYDVTGVEESAGGTGVKVKPGVRPCRIVRAQERTEKRDGSAANDIELALDFGSEFDWVFTYVGLGEASDWKLAELVRAVGLKDKGKLDLEKHVKGKVIRCKVNHGMYGEEYSPNAGRFMKAQPGDEDLIGEGVSEISSNDDAPVAEAEAGVLRWREGQPDPENPDEVVASYEDWTDEDLEGEVGDRELTVAGGRGKKRDKLIAALRADDADEENAGPTEAEIADADDYDTWELDALKKEWDDRQMGDLPAIKGRGASDRMKAAIIEELRKDDVENPFTS